MLLLKRAVLEFILENWPWVLLKGSIFCSLWLLEGTRSSLSILSFSPQNLLASVKGIFCYRKPKPASFLYVSSSPVNRFRFWYIFCNFVLPIFIPLKFCALAKFHENSNSTVKLRDFACFHNETNWASKQSCLRVKNPFCGNQFQIYNQMQTFPVPQHFEFYSDYFTDHYDC